MMKDEISNNYVKGEVINPIDHCCFYIIMLAINYNIMLASSLLVTCCVCMNCTEGLHFSVFNAIGICSS